MSETDRPSLHGRPRLVVVGNDQNFGQPDQDLIRFIDESDIVVRISDARGLGSFSGRKMDVYFYSEHVDRAACIPKDILAEHPDVEIGVVAWYGGRKHPDPEEIRPKAPVHVLHRRTVMDMCTTAFPTSGFDIVRWALTNPKFGGHDVYLANFSWLRGMWVESGVHDFRLEYMVHRTLADQGLLRFVGCYEDGVRQSLVDSAHPLDPLAEEIAIRLASEIKEARRLGRPLPNKCMGLDFYHAILKEKSRHV